MTRPRLTDAEAAAFAEAVYPGYGALKMCGGWNEGEVIRDATAELMRLRRQVARVSDWRHRHGAALVPPMGRANTFGEGMREAKQQVSDILSAGEGES